MNKFDFSLLSVPKLKLHFRYFLPLMFGMRNFDIQIDGLRLTLRPRTFDLYIVSEIFREDAYAISEFFKNPINTIVDLGANIGIFSIWAANKYSPKKLISVEMDKDNVDLLMRNIANNSNNIKTDFTVINKAVYSKDTKLSYVKTPINKGMHTLIESDSEKHKVEAITLDNILKANEISHIDILKIDIEGSEKHLLNEENKNIFASKVSRLAMEIHVDDTFTAESVSTYFKNIGYTSNIVKKWNSINYMFYAENTRFL